MKGVSETPDLDEEIRWKFGTEIVVWYDHALHVLTVRALIVARDSKDVDTYSRKETRHMEDNKPGRWSTPRVHRHRPAYRARHLVLKHVQKHITKAKRGIAGAEHDADADPPALDPGQERLYSFYAPGLEAGIHDITVTQKIHSPAVEGVPADEKDVVSTKTFRVSPPRFALPDGEVHSTYPPQDVMEEASVSADEFARNRTPWLALLSFSDDAIGQNELYLQPNQLNGPDSIFPPSMLQPGSPPIVQSATYSIYMAIQDLWKMSAYVTTPINAKQTGDPVDGSTKANIVFLPTSLFTSFVTKYNNDGTPVPQQSQPDVSRNAIHAGAVEATKKELLAHRYRSKESVIAQLTDTMAGLEDIFQGDKQTDMLSRWKRPREARINLSHRQNDETGSTYLKHGRATARKLASTTDGHPNHATPEQGPQTLKDVSSTPDLYNEFNTPYSNDWKIILNWVLDKMYLSNLPAHYLITDPSCLPNETLRFFHIDRNWIDCFLDGALSLANQVSRDDDQVRGIIKSILEIYITGELSPFFGYAPQIPSFGFLMRSSLVMRFPDLVITAPRAPGDLRAPILRQENIAKDTLLVLFDRLPSHPDFKSLIISQPQHQQFFSLGATLGPDPTAPIGTPHPPLELELIYTRVYAPVAKIDPHVKMEYDKDVFKSSDSPTVFDWKNRTLMFPAFAQRVYDKISSGMNSIVPNLPQDQVGPPAPNYTDTVGPDCKGLPSSALLGIQMNEPMYQMEVQIPSQGVAATSIGQTKSADVTKPVIPAASPQEAPQMPSSPQPYQIAISEPSRRQFPLPSPQERKRLPPSNFKHSELPLPPPHHRPRRIPTHFFDPSRTPNFKLDPPTTDQNFAISCHHISNFGKPVPTNIKAPMDLVFSIQLRQGYNTNWQLNYLHFEIPMETKTKPTAATSNTSAPLLRANYQDATAVMLSNQRFNAWGPVAAADNSFLNVVLQPRWAPKAAALDLKQEWSFVLNQVRVVQGYTGKVRVNVIQGFTAVNGPQPEQVRGFILVDLAPAKS
ncbi:uncharacterized protein AB675_11078 [Cyphellophora attinorum]|uniref:Uncharacterized protein n=1 Tax=Cyphellophora attinorum TaxID=1664694 RepID=A0A0N1H438_9EURO|nr:uncharacterized protein AB675_11078 [Phialophora attinorum]KPI35847.1 hypothetical protein AB675_11078 [Phialophora attinorum]